MAAPSKDATPMWDIMSPEDNKAMMEKFTAESNKVINRWSLGNATFTEKDAAVAFLVQLGAVEITIQSGSQQTTSQKQVSIVFGDGEDSKIDEEHHKTDSGYTKDTIPSEKDAILSEHNPVARTSDSSDQDAEKKNNVPVSLDQGTTKNRETHMNEDDDDEDNNYSVWMTEPDEVDDDNQIPDPTPVVDQSSSTQPREEHLCPDCQTVFHSLCDLDLHKLSSCKRVYNCDQCSKSFVAKGCAVKHLHEIHKMSLNEAGEKLRDLKSSERQNLGKRMQGKQASSNMPGSKQRGAKRIVRKRDCSGNSVPRQSKRLLLKLQPLSNGWIKILESKAVDVSGINSDESNGTAAVSNDKMSCKRDISTDHEPVNKESVPTQGDVKEIFSAIAALESNELEDHGHAEQIQEKDNTVTLIETQPITADIGKENGATMSKPQLQKSGMKTSKLLSDEYPGFSSVEKKIKEVNSAYDGDHDKVTTQKRAKFRKTSTTCKFCDLQFQSVRSRDKHMFITHPEEKQAYKCSTCNKSFIGKFQFKAHLKTHLDINDRKKYHCKICKKSFLTKFNCQKHMKSHVEKPEPFKCDTCGKLLSSKRGLERHINSQHKKEVVYTCEICGKNFYTTCYVKQHLETHAENRTFKCDECDFTALRKYRITEHKQQAHSHGPFLICEICGAAFQTPVILKQHHRNVHTECKFSCDVCGMKFRYACYLRRHMETHSNDPKDKPFQCEICGKCFPTRVRVKRHMDRHTNEQQSYICHHCGKTFQKKCSFDKHQFIHTGKKPHECHVCSQDFMDFSDLRKHLDIEHQITLKKKRGKVSYANLLADKLENRPSLSSTLVSDSWDRSEVSDAGRHDEASDSQIVGEALLAMMND